MKRHEAAVAVQEGIFDLRVISRALVEASEEAVKEGIGAERDAAVRALVYRLARLCKVDEISYGYDPDTLHDTFCGLMNELKARAKEGPPEGLPAGIRPLYTPPAQVKHDPKR